ncbi:hydroxypyruvate isomerase [Rhodobacter viridis]|uniref:Hydroxypyruvate isomerase n=1 Tax=Rhodobacter viridis TaxID=1054202 RepID=A0A318TQS0_9RHOB|nr:TIM barrel protein [Rhodobacter viridis]PYF07186.1 hydroxypyruvate isomerase [Rhodobacter viridis]
MIKLAADLTTLFQELPFAARFSAAQAAGFAGVSLASPYDGPVQELRDRLVLSGLVFAAMVAPPPNYTGAPQGFAATTGGEDRFQRDFKRMLRYADVLKPGAIEILTGPEGDTETLLRNLRWATAEAPKRLFTLAPRPEGSFLQSYDQLAEVLAEVGAGNLGISLDTALAAALGSTPEAVLERFGTDLRHVSLASAPDRAEPGADGWDVAGFLNRLEAAGYAGWVSADYTPKLTTTAGLGWMPPVPVAAPKTRKKRGG